MSLLLPRRPLCCSKADFGSAIIFAGSYGMEGAAILATKAAVRSGAGKVTCYSARCGYFLVQSAVPSALFLRDQSDVMITEIVLKHDYNAVGIGPGIGTDAAPSTLWSDSLRWPMPTAVRWYSTPTRSTA